MEKQLNMIIEKLTDIENKLNEKENKLNEKEKMKKYKKEYREKNKEKIKEYDKNYRENNKEKLKEKINCQYCNSLILKKNIKVHYTTMSCRKFWDSELLNSDDEE